MTKKKKKLSGTSLQRINLIAQTATRKAAFDAMAAGRTVAGWRDGRLVEFQSIENNPPTAAVAEGKD